VHRLRLPNWLFAHPLLPLLLACSPTAMTRPFGRSLVFYSGVVVAVQRRARSRRTRSFGPSHARRPFDRRIPPTAHSHDRADATSGEDARAHHVAEYRRSRRKCPPCRYSSYPRQIVAGDRPVVEPVRTEHAGPCRPVSQPQGWVIKGSSPNRLGRDVRT
jgi:hypothetical protein